MRRGYPKNEAAGRKARVYLFRISLARNWVERRPPAVLAEVRKRPFTWTAEPTTIPASSFVSPFTTTSREEIFQWPSGTSFVAGATGIDSTTPSNSVERSPDPGGAMTGALMIETATR